MNEIWSSISLCLLCVFIMLLQLLNSTHPSRIQCLSEIPECFANVTHNSIREQLPPNRTLQQEIEVRMPIMCIAVLTFAVIDLLQTHSPNI